MMKHMKLLKYYSTNLIPTNSIMRDKNRIKPILEKIEKLWILDPDLRFGQLVMNIIKPEQSNVEVYYMEDDNLFDKIEKFKE